MGMPWNEFLVFYNKRENTSYATVKDWILALYKDSGYHIKPVADLIGVSEDTMTKKLKELDLFQYQRSYVKRKKRIGAKESIYLGISDKTLLELTRQQIAERCCCHLDTVTKWMAKYGRAHKKLTNPNKYKNMTMRDWDQLVLKYNRVYGTSFKNEKELYSSLSPNIPVRTLCKLFDVSKPTIYNRVDLHGVKRKHTRGGSNNRNGTKAEAFLAIPIEDMAKMTLRQISNQIDADYGYCSLLVKKHNRTISRKRSLE